MLFTACHTPAPEPQAPEIAEEAGIAEVQEEVTPPTIDLDTAEWVDMAGLDSALVFDLRYATPDNFTGEVLYPCGRCLLRPAVAQALLAALEDLQTQGYGLKLYDCYRPHFVQWKLWKIKPDRRYVTDPEKGSMHNRGGAVDLTLTDASGEELDMGTGYDYFGQEAWHTYQALPEAILQRRKALKTAMEKHGFGGIRTEWWHYSYKKRFFPLSDFQWPCPG